MNKLIVHLGFLLGIGSLFCNNERAIRKHLEFLYKNYAINYVQIAEKNVSLLDVIDRDIIILENHIARLQHKIDNNKGFWMQRVLPFIKTTTGLGGIAVGLYGSLASSCLGAIGISNYFSPPKKELCLCAGILLASTCITLTSLKILRSRFRHYSNIEKSIEIWKNKIKRDNAIILYLKELKYQL